LPLKPGSTRQSWTLKIPRVVDWSPDNAHLYSVVMRVSCNDIASDVWTTRFGMRKFTIREKKFYLNGKPLYLKATSFEGLYPVKLAYPDSREMIGREIRLAKEAGFNMIRPWRKPPRPMWLDLADEMGVLTVGSMVVECMDFPADWARLAGWVENQVRESIRRAWSRTCVVQWELFNEITERQPNLKRLLRPMSVLARQFDPTRLILDESGGWAQGANIYLPYGSEPTKFNDIHDYPGPQINDEVYTKLLLTGSKTHEEMRAMGLGRRLPGKNVLPGRMSFFSELGSGSLPDQHERDGPRKPAGTNIGRPHASPREGHGDCLRG
jgi:beta-galactosidase